jgi:hypothetical protein
VTLADGDAAGGPDWLAPASANWTSPAAVPAATRAATAIAANALFLDEVPLLLFGMRCAPIVSCPGGRPEGRP